ncbi:hypothetical protein FE840_020370 (plasmid) [Peteryoungia desertarenae]|uniref:Uncharacterized protein n=1 Tax=Peteryoungia desertarenae TaxID=1813451 RepID=A0ABX6QUN9_9HYPH|nr:hypothetical protein [Peteryoungia desertarenae]QLF71955.1 hypothetical protein FE840_020370 [Peteryoungia desertarenae]
MSDQTVYSSERDQELLALINMTGYLMGVAGAVGASSALEHLNAARDALAAELESQNGNTLDKANLLHWASARTGSC